MQLASGEETPLTEIVSVIRADAAFSTEILRLANSSLFGFTREVSSVLHAVGLLGLERVRGLALTVALRRFLGEAAPSTALRTCWRHNLACAIVAEELAVATFLPPDSVCTAGVVHDLGRLAMLVSDPDRYAGLLHDWHSDARCLCQAERELFGTDHCEAGAVLMEQWQFPRELVQIAAEHHRPVRTDRLRPLELVQLACRIADSLGFQVAGDAPPYRPDELLNGLAEPARFRLSSAPDELVTRIALKINSFEISC